MEEQPKRVGVVELRLAAGPIPHYREIVKLSGAVIGVLVNDFGTREVIKRFSDPLWMNCYACTVGFEWMYSGLTTVPLIATKEALEKENLGLKIVGGKGKKARATNEIPSVCESLGLGEKEIEEVKKASKLTCKVDTCEIQDNHSLYFHSMLIDEKGNYVTINQKMNIKAGTARRFHWINNPKQFIEEPYNACVGSKQKTILNLTSRKSRECRKTMVDIVQDTNPQKMYNTILSLNREIGQTKITEFLGMKVVKLPYYLNIPRRISLEALKNAHELAERNFEDLLGIKGLGPATIRGLAYVSKLIYGTPCSFRDPVKYTFAFGTKVKIPYPLEKKAMVEVADILKNAVEEAKIGKMEKIRAIRRIENFLKI
ncbi:MAG: DUF763 domain-containing protein [Candidatus Aenigmarchaeota archaeon]|nr:DUF763 domain-containing protein [Candidatus Aenigmarchaeota archaeon]